MNLITRASIITQFYTVPGSQKITSCVWARYDFILLFPEFIRNNKKDYALNKSSMVLSISRCTSVRVNDQLQ